MNFEDIKNKEDFKRFIEARAKYKNFNTLLDFIEDENITLVNETLINDFNISEKNLEQCLVWLKGFSSDKYVLIDCSHMLKNKKELNNLIKSEKRICFSTGFNFYTGAIYDKDLFISNDDKEFNLSQIKQLWEVKKI